MEIIGKFCEFPGKPNVVPWRNSVVKAHALRIKLLAHPSKAVGFWGFGVFHVLLRVIFQPSRLSCCKHATLTCGTMAGWGKKFHRPRGGVLRVKRLQAAGCRLQVSRTCAGFRNLELGRGSLFIMVNQPHRARIIWHGSISYFRISYLFTYARF